MNVFDLDRVVVDRRGECTLTARINMLVEFGGRVHEIDSTHADHSPKARNVDIRLMDQPPENGEWRSEMVISWGTPRGSQTSLNPYLLHGNIA